MDKPLILVVEDDRAVRSLVTTTLDTHDYKYITAQNGQQALLEIVSRRPNIILLDLGLPDMDGIEIIKKVRSWSIVPIIVISARSEDKSKIEALDTGADDYLTKPFEMEEFFARVLSLIRRYTRLNNMASKEILKYGDLRIDLESGIVELSGEELKLSAKEYDVLIYLAKNQGKILTKKQIYENVWNEEYVYDDDNIMAVISRLRKKIERTAENSYIQTVRGLGYRFNKEL